MTAGRASTWLGAIAAILLCFVVLAMPNQPAAWAWRSFAVIPLELPAVIAFILLGGQLGPKVSRIARSVVMVGALAIILLKMLDFAMFVALSREFNLAFDGPLVSAGWMLLKGAKGFWIATVYVGFALAGLAVIAWLFWSTTGALAQLRLRSHWTAAAAVIALAMWVIPWPAGGVLQATTTRIAIEHVMAARAAASEIASLEVEARDDVYANAAPETLLQALRGTDVFVAFVESYGRSSLDNPLYADTTIHALVSVAAAAEGRQLEARSAWLTSPTFGGQSWLAHSTLLSGLWINSQGRYAALVNGSRQTLLGLARQAGWRTVGVMPAMTMPWPEGSFFGYDRVLAASDLGYKGLPFNWVTMPDQYTWAAFERLELDNASRRPIFAELSLISSHAPWTPIPRLVPRSSIGDGSIFNEQATSGDSPEIVWSDHDRVRDQFRQSIDYALRAIADFITGSRQDRPVLYVILGDHQPAAFISGSSINRDVPIHLIGDAKTLALLDQWGWTKGLVPNADAPVWRMDRFRDAFIEAFSKPASPPHTGGNPA